MSYNTNAQRITTQVLAEIGAGSFARVDKALYRPPALGGSGGHGSTPRVVSWDGLEGTATGRSLLDSYSLLGSLRVQEDCPDE